MKTYMIYIRRFLKDGLSYFFKLPRHLILFGLGVSAAVFLFLIWQKLRRKEKLRAGELISLAALLLYLVFSFIITTLARTPDSVRRYDLSFSYTLRAALTGSWYSAEMMLFNLLLLAPLGFLTPLILDYRCTFRDILFLSLMMSLSIECTQFLFRLGLLEGDDLLHNCLGALAGYLLAILLRKAVFFFRDWGNTNADRSPGGA